MRKILVKSGLQNCEWKKPLLPKEEYLVTQTPTFQEAKNGIMNNESFGFVKCNIHVPEAARRANYDNFWNSHNFQAHQSIHI